MLITRNLLISALLVSAALPTAAFAQATLDSGVIDRPAKEVNVPKNFQLQSQKAEPLQQKPEVEAVARPNEVFATVSSITFEGNSKVKEDQLQVIASPYLNRPITNRDLAELKYKIAKEYYRRGFTLVKALTPQQSLAGGVLKIRVIEALVGNVNLVKNDALSPYVANAFAKRVSKGAVFHEQDAESLVSDLNGVKNVNATMTLVPGSEFSTTDLNVTVEPTKGEDENYATVDNYGNTLTGRYVGRVHLEKSNALQFGERVYVDGRASDDKLYSGTVGVDVPTTLRNIYFHTSYGYTQNDVGGSLRALNIEGQSDTWDIAASSALVNTRDEKINVRGGMEVRHHESDVQNVRQWEDDIRQGYVDGSYLYRGDSSVWYASTRISKNLDAFGASSENNIPQPNSAARSRADGNNDGFIVRPSVLVNYQPEAPFLRDGRIEFTSTGQLASNTLLSSDLFVIGGYGSVRGFEPALLTGEEGYQYTLEYQHDIPVHPNWTVSAGPWIDGGAVFNRKPSVSVGQSDRTLTSTGLGAEATSELLKGVGDTKFRIDWAHPIGHYDAVGVDDDFFYFRVSQNF